jgi:uncharacterized protein YndB with AHSA1/START domain
VFIASADLAAPSEVVFGFLTEPPKLKTWIGGLVESRPLGDGELRVGARALEIVEEGGRRMEMSSVVTVVEPMRRLAVAIHSYFALMENEFHLEPGANGGTRLTQTLRVRYRGWMRLPGLFLGGMTQRKLEADLARLKTVLTES